VTTCLLFVRWLTLHLFSILIVYDDSSLVTAKDTNKAQVMSSQ